MWLQNNIKKNIFKKFSYYININLKKKFQKKF